MNKNNKWLYGIGIFTIIFVIVSVVFRNLTIDDLPIQVTGTLFGVVITAIITVFLLNGQSASEEQRDKSLLVFEKKQEIYHNFLNNLKKIIMDGQVSISTQYQDGQEAIDELKDLLFELGYVQMHTSEQNTQQIFHKVATIIQLLNDFEQEGMHKQKALPQFYAQLSTELFSIVAILKEDLYGKTANTIDLQHVKELLESCNLFLDSQEVDKYELQNYFWDEVQDQLLSLGHEFTKKDFTADVSQYYARSRNRYRYYGLEFPIYRLKDGTIANFKLELGDELYYGLFKSEKDESNPIIEQAVQNIIGFNISSYWFAWKFFDRNRLNFWSLNSEGIERLKHPRRREKLIREIAEELDLYIKKIQNELQHIEQEEPTK